MRAQTASQDSSWVATLRDGSTHVGKLVRETPDSVELRTKSGQMTISRSALQRFRHVSDSDLHDGAWWSPDPHSTRLFFGPTGRTLDAGEGYFTDFYLFFVAASYGITDRFTMGGGLSVFPSSELSNNIFFLTPKFALVRGESFNLSAGALIGFAGKSAGSAGLLYVAATNGDKDHAFTYGAGWSYFGDRVYGGPTLLLGGEVRIARHVALLSENYVTTGQAGGYVLPMYGLRFIGEKLSADLGFVNALGKDVTPIFPGIPWVGFALKF